MGALRWILLVAGVVFLAALTLWELRRPRQGRGGAAAPPTQRSEPPLGAIVALKAKQATHSAGQTIR